MIVVIDYDVGNLGSLQNALKRLNFDVKVSRDKEDILNAQGIILPGVGAFNEAMNNLKKYDLIDVLKEAKNKNIPILGICLGMQILFEKGYENKETEGLGFLKGYVDKIETIYKVPHMGWNQLNLIQDHPLIKYIKPHDYVYFVHSYKAYPSVDELICDVDYGTLIPAIVAKDNVMGCQFHPEKSALIGEKILKAFKEMIQ